MTRRRRTPVPLALALVVAALGSTAVAATLTVDVGRDAVTPVERYRQEALADVRTSTKDVKAAKRSGKETPASAEGIQHVFSFDFHDATGKRFSAQDQGTDIEFYSPTVDGKVRDYAIVGSYDRGAFIFDVTDPENTRFVKQIVCQQRQNDIQIRQFGTRWVAMLSNDESGTLCAGRNIGPTSLSGGAAFFDVTDPRNPVKMYNLRVVDGVHNWTWHPTEPVAYVSTGDLPGGIDHLPVYDFADVDNPKLVDDQATEGGPHDMTFSADGKRGYVASENNVRVYDTTDPRKPVLLSRGPAVASYVHGSDPTPDGKTLLVTDESLVLGGFFASNTAVCPGGGITLFDTQTPGVLTPLSYLVADIQGPSGDHRACTAHVGRFTPDSKHYVTGWYYGGVRLFDISDPSSPSEVGHIMMPRSEVWSAKFHKGPYVFTGDLGRGFDVYKVTGTTLGTPPLTAS